MSSVQKSLKSNAIYGFIRAFMNLAFPLISFPYASRILLPAGIGKVNFANSIIEYFVLFATLGSFTYATREAIKVKDDRVKLSKICREIITINAISTLTSYILLIFAFFFVPKFNEYRIIIIVCSSKILFTTLGTDWIFNAFEEYRYITIRSVIFQFLSLILLFTCVKTPNDYIKYAIMGVSASVGANFCNVFYVGKFINFFEKTKIEIKRHLRPIFVFFGMTCAEKLHTALDTVMIGFMLDDVSVGYYSAANKIKTLVVGLMISMLYTLMPRSSYYFEKNNVDDYKKIVSRAAKFTLFFSIPATIGVILIRKQLIMVFSGKEFLSAIPTMIVLSPVIIAISFGCFLDFVILTPQRKEKYSFYSQIIGCSLNICLNYFLILKLHVLGAAIATLIVETTIMSYRMFFCRKYLKNCGLLKTIFQIFIGCALMCASVFMVKIFIHSEFLILFFSIIVCCTVYAFSMILMKNETANLVLEMIRKKIKK